MQQYPPPPPPYNAPMGGVPSENPEGTKALIVAILGLLCCGPLAVWSLVLTNDARKAGFTDTKTTVAYVLSIVGIVLWVAGTMYSMAMR